MYLARQLKTYPTGNLAHLSFRDKQSWSFTNRIKMTSTGVMIK